MKRYEANSICSNCKGFVKSKFHEVIQGAWTKATDTIRIEKLAEEYQDLYIRIESENHKLKEQNNEMFDKLKRYKDLVEEYGLDDDEELLIEMERFIEKIEWIKPSMNDK